MKHARNIVLTILLAIYSCSSFAQTGCLVSTGNVYTSPDNVGLVNFLLIAIFGGVAAYKPTPFEPQYSACVSESRTQWTATSSPCRVCPSGYNVLNLLTGCSGTSLDGSIANKSTVYCDLDDHSWILGAAAGLFGVFVIRRRNKL
jgi:hypothetical protein